MKKQEEEEEEEEKKIGRKKIKGNALRPSEFASYEVY